MAAALHTAAARGGGVAQSGAVGTRRSAKGGGGGMARCGAVGSNDEFVVPSSVKAKL